MKRGSTLAATSAKRAISASVVSGESETLSADEARQGSEGYSLAMEADALARPLEHADPDDTETPSTSKAATSSGPETSAAAQPT